MSGAKDLDASRVLDVLSAAASVWGDRPAVTGSGESLSYLELLAGVRDCASWIRRADIGAPLVVVPSSTPTDVVTILGAVAAGGCPLVADQAWTDRELEHVLRATRAGGFLSRRDVPPAGVTATGQPWRGMTIGRCRVRLATAVDALSGIGFGRFTSGTTGGSRCLGFSEEAAVRAAASWRQAAELSAADTVLCLATLNNGLAFNTCLLSVFGAGARLVLHAGRPIPSSIARALRNVSPTVLVAFPFAFDALTSTGRVDRGALRLAVSSAAALAPETQERWRELTDLGVCNYYGLVETGPVTFNDASVPGSVGSPLPGAEIILEPYESSPSAVGRVLVRTSSMASRYLDGNTPGLSESITSDGFYRTNDLGFLDRTGHLHLTGRAGAVVNVAGRKIDPTEVAAVIRSIPGVHEAVVRGEQVAGAEILAAYVESTSVERHTIVEHCRHCLAEYKLPQRIIIRDSFPRSSTGKVALARLTDEYPNT